MRIGSVGFVFLCVFFPGSWHPAWAPFLDHMPGLVGKVLFFRVVLGKIPGFIFTVVFRFGIGVWVMHNVAVG